MFHIKDVAFTKIRNLLYVHYSFTLVNIAYIMNRHLLNMSCKSV